MAFDIIVPLLGGLGLFLYGMKIMGDGLENAAGDRLKSILEKVTSNPILAVIIGAIVTAIVQSSSATTVMVVGFVNAGLLNLVQATGIIMGANVGTTITAQLIAFKLEEIAPIAIAIGAVIVIFAKNSKKKEIGNIILGFGILFIGMDFMKNAMMPLRTMPEFQNLITLLGHNWALSLLLGLLMTGIVQSSSATTAIIVSMAGAGVVTFNVALPFIFGCNIGTCVTALMASIGSNKLARKAAVIHLLFNVVGTLIFLPLAPLLSKIVVSMTPDDIKRQIANAHTIFNIVTTVLMLPFIKVFVKVVNTLIKGDDKEDTEIHYIDERLLETPVIAVGQVAKATIEMATKAKENLQISLKALKECKREFVDQVQSNELVINKMENEITDFLVKLSNAELDSHQLAIVTSTFHIVNDIERIGDHAENIAELALEKMEKNIDITEDALVELEGIFKYTENSLELSIEAYTSNDLAKANSVQQYEERVDSLEKELRSSHIRRLHLGACNAYAGTLFLDVISNLERISDHAMNIAESVINNQ